jgi:hypothetical protein
VNPKGQSGDLILLQALRHLYKAGYNSAYILIIHTVRHRKGQTAVLTERGNGAMVRGQSVFPGVVFQSMRGMGAATRFNSLPMPALRERLEVVFIIRTVDCFLGILFTLIVSFVLYTAHGLVVNP